MSITTKLLTKYLLESFKQDENELSEEMITDQPTIDYNLDDQIGNIWIVKKALKESGEDDLLQETDIFGLAEMINQQQISRADIHGIYQVENKARRVSRKQITERDSSHKAFIKEAQGVNGDLNKKIASIRAEVALITKKGVDDPTQRDTVSSELEPLLSQLTRLEDLQTRLEGSIEKEKPKKEVKKSTAKKDSKPKDKDKKEDE